MLYPRKSALIRVIRVPDPVLDPQRAKKKAAEFRGFLFRR
jgi:hypothetical protein